MTAGPARAPASPGDGAGPPPPRWRFDLPELSGALGDLGTFVPLAASLIAVCGMDAGSVLVFAGAAHVATGLVFRQPIPVQPMKAIAAVAIAEGLAPGEIAAAGFATGAAVLVLGLSGLVGVVERRVPRPVVRGIQLGVGMSLAMRGLDMVLPLGWWAPDGRVLALGAAALIVATRGRRFPAALVVVAAGALMVALSEPDLLRGTPTPWAGPAWVLPDAAAWSRGLVGGALPQIPLTLLNSVIAVSALSEDLFPGRGVRPRAMALSVGIMNTATCLLGAMPACHGSGGLAGQYRFGARTGGSVLVLGVTKMGLGLALGPAVGALLLAFPHALLGVLLVFAGLELALAGLRRVGRDGAFLALATAVGIAAANTAVGFL
ncbi:MAG: putative sulfate/molybdate transporter, partial [Myxococcota bacterium]|nr:putative sulfate/molybdate transporter [Myxococcota bacterium]